MISIIKMQSANEMRQHRERFEAVFQRYRVSLCSQKPYDKEALRFAYGKFCNHDIELIESIIDVIASDSERALSMSQLCQQIKQRLDDKHPGQRHEQEQPDSSDLSERLRFQRKLAGWARLPESQRQELITLFIEHGHEQYTDFCTREQFRFFVDKHPGFLPAMILSFLESRFPLIYADLG